MKKLICYLYETGIPFDYRFDKHNERIIIKPLKLSQLQKFMIRKKAPIGCRICDAFNPKTKSNIITIKLA